MQSAALARASTGLRAASALGHTRPAAAPIGTAWPATASPCPHSILAGPPLLWGVTKDAHRHKHGAHGVARGTSDAAAEASAPEAIILPPVTPEGLEADRECKQKAQ